MTDKTRGQLRMLTIPQERRIVARVADAMDGREWNAETLEAIQAAFNDAGVSFEEPRT